MPGFSARAAPDWVTTFNAPVISGKTATANPCLSLVPRHSHDRSMVRRSPTQLVCHHGRGRRRSTSLETGEDNAFKHRAPRRSPVRPVLRHGMADRQSRSSRIRKEHTFKNRASRRRLARRIKGDGISTRQQNRASRRRLARRTKEDGICTSQRRAFNDVHERFVTSFRSRSPRTFFFHQKELVLTTPVRTPIPPEEEGNFELNTRDGT
jgi:hypothetical protein